LPPVSGKTPAACPRGRTIQESCGNDAFRVSFDEGLPEVMNEGLYGTGTIRGSARESLRRSDGEKKDAEIVPDL
jgi:hypothetical protein